MQAVEAFRTIQCHERQAKVAGRVRRSVWPPVSRVLHALSFVVAPSSVFLIVCIGHLVDDHFANQIRMHLNAGA